MAINNCGSKLKSYLWWSVISISILLAFTAGLRSKGAHSIANRSVKPIYTWKSGALQLRGGVVPDTCALTTKKCICNLSTLVPSCTFNFNFYDLNADTFIDVKRRQISPAIVVSKSIHCSQNKTHQIQNCLVNFRWNKKDPVHESVNIVMLGRDGAQTIVDLQIATK